MAPIRKERPVEASTAVASAALVAGALRTSARRRERPDWRPTIGSWWPAPGAEEGRTAVAPGGVAATRAKPEKQAGATTGAAAQARPTAGVRVALADAASASQ